MATLVQSVTVLHPSDNNANTSAGSDLGPTRDYERASPLSQASAACIQPSHNGERGNRRNSVLTSLLCLTRDITHFHGN